MTPRQCQVQTPFEAMPGTDTLDDPEAVLITDTLDDPEAMPGTDMLRGNTRYRHLRQCQVQTPFEAIPVTDTLDDPETVLITDTLDDPEAMSGTDMLRGNTRYRHP